MRRLMLVAFSLSLGSVSVKSAMAQGDTVAGHTFAQEWCARCHDITPDGPFKQTPPSFAAIARFRAADDIRWRIQYPAVHSDMPRLGFVLDPQTLDQLVAFIISLAPAGDE